MYDKNRQPQLLPTYQQKSHHTRLMPASRRMVRRSVAWIVLFSLAIWLYHRRFMAPPAVQPAKPNTDCFANYPEVVFLIYSIKYLIVWLKIN